jgi:hypothetical protein
LGIFDFDGTTAKRSGPFRFCARRKGNRVEVISPDLPRSIIVTLDRIYYSHPFPRNLASRMKRDHLARKEHSSEK